MPPVKAYQRKPSKRQQVQRTPSAPRRLLLGGGILGMTLFSLWSYYYLPRLAQEFCKKCEITLGKIGFAVNDVVLEGRLRTPKKQVLNLLELERGYPIFSVDLEKSKEKLERLPWIKRASVERVLPDTLLIRVVEKKPVSLWQYKGKAYLMDKDGELIETKNPYSYKKLLIITGEKAPQHIGDLFGVLEKVPVLNARITGATYLRSGRWDLRLDGRIDIKLPDRNPAQALAYLLHLEQKHHFINQDIMVIDMRIPGQLVLRLTPEALQKQKNSGKHA